MKQVLITGGTGFLGQALVRDLVARGDAVIVLTRHILAPSKGTTFIQSLDSIEADTQIDACINLAGEPLFNGPWTAGKKHKIWNSRCKTTQNIVSLNQRLQQPIPLLLSGSASGYYGDKGQHRVPETAEAGNHFGAKLCQEWESIAMQAGVLGTRVCLLRTGIVLGSGGALKPLIPLYRWGLGSALGSGQQFWPCIHQEDWVAAVLFCLDNNSLSGPINLCSPQAVTQQEVSDALALACHRKIWLPNIPRWFLRLVTMTSSDLLTDSAQMVPEALTNAGFVWSTADCRVAIKKVVAATERGH